MKTLLSLSLFLSLSVTAADQAITQWVYNTLERAQANIDKGNLEAAEKIYYDYANDTWSSRSYDHFVFLRTYAYFLLSYDRNEEALRYLKQASLKRDMPPYDIFELYFTLGQVYYVTGDRENAKKTLLKWVETGERYKLDLKPEGYAILATIYAQDEEWGSALKFITLAIDNSYRFVEDWAQLKFAIHTERKEYLDALEISQDLVRYKPKNKQYIEQMAGIYNIIRFEEESLATLEFKLQQDLLTKPSEYINLANFYLYKGLPVDSSKVIEKGIKLKVLESNIKNNELLSNAYITAKDFDNAVKSLVKVTQITDDPKYDYRIGQIQLQNSKYSQAIKYFKIARNKGWNRKPGSLEMLLGVCYIEVDDFKNARLELKKAIDLGKESEANPWLSYIESTEGLRAAASS
tara:strand:- start:1400 stop:2617 length:1218 start_codon:yes stop_codon:yes gene_type:complete